MSEFLVVTGGAGFIGSSFVRQCLSKGHKVVVLDSLTYAGHLENIQGLLDEKNCFFVKANICDLNALRQVFDKFKPKAFLNFAAESHVDNSITNPGAFVETNINGTYTCLLASFEYFKNLNETEKKAFRYLQVSTDEVYGSLGPSGQFTEQTPYAPNSPYSASKAAGDMLTRAWFHTYKLPTLITNCSNNYGPRQFPEKLIPKTILCCLDKEPIPVYGTGENVRDWIYVDDHSNGVLTALLKGTPGETYCFGGESERSNLQVVKSITKIFDELKGNPAGTSEKLIQFVTDRAGHDWRYAIDNSKSKTQLGYHNSQKSFESGLMLTVKWYLENSPWIDSVQSKNKS